MTTTDDLALVPVINYHLNEAIRLMKATGEVADLIVWDELRVYMPPATSTKTAETANPPAHDAGYGSPGKGW